MQVNWQLLSLPVDHYGLRPSSVHEGVELSLSPPSLTQWDIFVSNITDVNTLIDSLIFSIIGTISIIIVGLSSLLLAKIVIFFVEFFVLKRDLAKAKLNKLVQED